MSLQVRMPVVLLPPLVLVGLGTYVSLLKTPLNYNAVYGITLVGLGYLIFLCSLQLLFPGDSKSNR